MRGGTNAAYIDAEYKKIKAYQSKRRICKNKQCKGCIYEKACENNEAI